jgi:hypothetical protein
VIGIFSNSIDLIRQLSEDEILREKIVEQEAANFCFLSVIGRNHRHYY